MKHCPTLALLAFVVVFPMTAHAQGEKWSDWFNSRNVQVYPNEVYVESGNVTSNPWGCAGPTWIVFPNPSANTKILRVIEMEMESPEKFKIAALIEGCQNSYLKGEAISIAPK